MRKYALVALLIAAGSVSAGAASLVNAANPQDILDVARGYGSAELGKTSSGNPKVTGKIDSYRYAIYFSGCKNGVNCTSLQFYATWTSDVTLSKMNSWNRDKMVGKAYLDEDGNPSLELWVNLYDGVTADNLDDTFDWWKTIMKSFADFIS